MSEEKGGSGFGEPGRLSPDQKAAHDLLTELRTRISTQKLPYQYGVEARALESLWEIFGLARKAIKDNPGCREFAQIATTMLNVVLRPMTAKWHRAKEAGLLDSRDGANDFRVDLAQVRGELVAFAENLQMLAYGKVIPDEQGPEVLSPAQVQAAFLPVKFGQDEGIARPDGGCSPEKCINADEAAEIFARRRLANLTPNDFDAIGLALSGGGIRSATFCLGVVQVLAERGLMKDFDYLSTVSGGGYTGSLVSSVIGSGGSFEELAKPYGPDTDAVRHVRQNAKYLSAVNLRQRWIMITGTLSGMIMNWIAPLCFLSFLALLFIYLGDAIPSQIWSQAAIGLSIVTLVAIYISGFSLRAGTNARSGAIVVAISAGAALAFAIVAAIEWGLLKFDALLNSKISGAVVLSVLAGPAVARFMPVFRSETFRKNFLRIALYAASLVVPLLAVAVFYLLRELGRMPMDSEAPWYNPVHYLCGTAVLGCLFLLSLLFSLLGLDVNLTGPHKLYRDALAATFVRPKTGGPTLPLTSLNGSKKAPYHLINAAVNLPSSTRLVLRDRKADFFLFSQHWMGSKAVRYSRSKAWVAKNSEVDLATAMAISGAAASPHMGLGSKPTLSAIMTLLNIRLGYWIANPKEQTFWNFPGFICLVREMFGIGMTEKHAWLNISDGGHIENMGIYELLRRRCKFIVCVDGEADPESTFHGQLTLVRHAQIDLGIRVEPRLDDMRPDPKSRFSKTHVQLFRVIYPETLDGRPPGIGLMLYLKLSLTGNEAELLKRYRLLHPEFPHQSTLDQFYDEEQFEAYRQLGVHVAEGTFSPALMTSNTHPATVQEWFRQLAENMLEPFGA
ncbi:patatin-like phospholipase family protein [Bradyrhizobium sp. SZCCHNS3052]|uniref:patatin-like phospholipase family protein n=1 Tax=Bradyrhizobium sp. SZCCHNS3052 TaxID=3057321 RepID=UPI0029163664|nr:patatin-like phospholipase family protein [Bradyrhizobium sp. SZCCHNS3052]